MVSNILEIKSVLLLKNLQTTIRKHLLSPKKITDFRLQNEPLLCLYCRRNETDRLMPHSYCPVFVKPFTLLRTQTEVHENAFQSTYLRKRRLSLTAVSARENGYLFRPQHFQRIKTTETDTFYSVAVKSVNPKKRIFLSGFLYRNGAV